MLEALEDGARSKDEQGWLGVAAEGEDGRAEEGATARVGLEASVGDVRQDRMSRPARPQPWAKHATAGRAVRVKPRAKRFQT